jgi:GTP-binding protein
MIDSVEVHVHGGRGGDGIVSFRREKFVPRGGPDGGDGGRGGDVIVLAQRRQATLGSFHHHQVIEAEDGQPGGPNHQRGASGSSAMITVPVGTVVWDAGDATEPIADLTQDGASVVVAQGGRGGFGNKRFTSATRQAPRFAQRGSEGDERSLRLELKLLADVGIVGLPNAGKSTLLGTLSRARPRVANYPFTTLEPELGVVNLGYDAFVAADLPGLIEGASSGVGLGHEFLRHIERTRVLVHVLDMSRDDPLDDLAVIDGELSAFGHGLDEKPQLLALNKIDDPNAAAHVELLQDDLSALERPLFAISAATGAGTRELANAALERLRELDEADPQTPVEAVPVLRPQPRRRRFEVHMDEVADIAVIEGPTPEWLAKTLPLEVLEARQEFFRRLRELGVARALGRIGVKPGDPVSVGGVTVRWDV